MISSQLLTRSAVLAALLTAAPAFAVPTIHTSEAGFDSATSEISLTIEGFETPFAAANTLTFGDLAIGCANCSASRSSSYPSAGVASLAINGGQPLSFAFAAPVNAFGFSIRDFGTLSTTNLWLTVNGVTVPLLSSFLGSSGNTRYFGVTDSSPFSSVVLSGGVSGDNYYLDKVSFGAAIETGAVPEPASWAMLIAGFGLVGGMMRRQNKQIALA